MALGEEAAGRDPLAITFGSSEFLEDGGCSLICASHWATESLWLPVLAQKLREEARRLAITCEVKVSTIVTEPWSLHLDTEGSYL